MKKLLSLLMASAIVFTLAGCEEKEITKKYEGTQDKMKMTEVITAKGDEVTKENITLTMKYADLGANTPELKKVAQKSMSDSFAVIKKAKGVKYEEKSTDEELQIIVDIDYSKADMKELSKAQILQNAKEGDKVSLKETEDALKKEGFKEVK